jgi:hypothetical protein
LHHNVTIRLKHIKDFIIRSSAYLRIRFCTQEDIGKIPRSTTTADIYIGCWTIYFVFCFCPNKDVGGDFVGIRPRDSAEEFEDAEVSAL